MRGWKPRFSSTLKGGRTLVSTGLPSSSKVTLAMPGPVVIASTRSLPVTSPGSGGTMRIVWSPEAERRVGLGERGLRSGGSGRAGCGSRHAAPAARPAAASTPAPQAPAPRGSSASPPCPRS